MEKNVNNRMFSKKQVAGCVILYNSAKTVTEYINSYIDQIDHLYVIDNSEDIQHDIVHAIHKIPHVSYVPNNDNKGVAFALNQAANLAIESKYVFLLTMDDDTLIPPNSVEKMLLYYQNNDSYNVGIVSGQSDPRLYGNSIRDVGFAITSGSLVNLSTYKKVGPFKNELFIDFVDHEYCYRLIEKGYKIIELNYVYLKHKLGQKKQFKPFGFSTPLEWNSHNPLRIFYKTRNSLFVVRSQTAIDFKYKYPFYKEIMKDFLKIVFLENEKKQRFKFFIKAIEHALMGKLGKYIV